MLKLEQLKCEHLKNPIGIENRNPVFSWILAGNEKMFCRLPAVFRCMSKRSFSGTAKSR